MRTNLPPTPDPYRQAALLVAAELSDALDLYGVTVPEAARVLGVSEHEADRVLSYLDRQPVSVLHALAQWCGTPLSVLVDRAGL